MADWRAEGKEIPPLKESSFDSNVITPGTEFMAVLSGMSEDWARRELMIAFERHLLKQALY
jgi:5'-3' exonuclease